MDKLKCPQPLSEKDVGITEFSGSHEGFFAIIKQRLVLSLAVFFL